MIAQYLMISRNMQAQIAYGMHFAVTCSEDSPRWAGVAVDAQQLRDSYMGDALMAGMKTICSVWPRGPVDPDFNAPLHSEVPTLLLSGGNDPVTPAAYGERAAQELHARQTYHVARSGSWAARGGLHAAAGRTVHRQRACSPNDDLKCLKNVAPTPFMLSTTATAP